MRNNRKMPHLCVCSFYLEDAFYLETSRFSCYIDSQAAEPPGVRISEAKKGTRNTESQARQESHAMHRPRRSGCWKHLQQCQGPFQCFKSLKLEGKTFNPQGSGFLNDTIQKLHHLILAECKSLAEFCNFAS